MMNMSSPILLSQKVGFVSRFAPKPTTRKDFSQRVDNLPLKLMRDLGAKLYLLANLSWGYVDTVCSMCIGMRLDETKKLVREIRNLKREYDLFRAPTMGDKETRQEEEMGVWFEESFLNDFNSLFNQMNLESGRTLSDDLQKMYLVSLHQALTIIEAVKKFALYGDERLKEHGVWTCPYCMLQREFLLMHDVLKKFPSAKEERFNPLRERSASILVNRLHQIEVSVNKDGNIVLKEKSNSTDFEGIKNTNL